MKDTRMPPAQSANLVANSGNTIYGVSVIGIIKIRQFPGRLMFMVGIPYLERPSLY